MTLALKFVGDYREVQVFAGLDVDSTWGRTITVEPLRVKPVGRSG